MAKEDFTLAEFASRLGRVRARMAERGLDWLIAIHPASIHWITGSDAKSYQEFQCLLIGAESQPLIVLTRQGEVNEFEACSIAGEVQGFGGGETEDPIAALATLARKHKLIGKRIGLEVPSFYLHPYHYLALRDLLGADRVSDASDLIADLKLVKSPAEIGYIRKAAALCDKGLERFIADLAPGKSELALAGAVYDTLFAADSGIAASPINLVSGPRSAFSHGAPTERRLVMGDFGNIEFGATWKRYTATIGRQFMLGKPTPRMRELYDTVRHAADAMIAAIRAGVPATVPHDAAKQIIGAAGLEPYRVHLSGYGLAAGFPPSWAESLALIGKSPHRLEAGMVITVEPPVFIGEEGVGARIIDNVLVTETGCELLSGVSRDLIIV